MYTKLTMMAIEGFSIICMLVVGYEVYKLDKFKNKYIFFLLLCLNLSLYSDFTLWILRSKQKNLTSSNHDWHLFLGFLTINFM